MVVVVGVNLFKNAFESYRSLFLLFVSQICQYMYINSINSKKLRRTENKTAVYIYIFEGLMGD